MIFHEKRYKKLINHFHINHLNTGRIVKRNGARCLLVTVKPFPAMEDVFAKVSYVKKKE